MEDISSSGGGWRGYRGWRVKVPWVGVAENTTRKILESGLGQRSRMGVESGSELGQFSQGGGRRCRGLEEPRTPLEGDNGFRHACSSHCNLDSRIGGRQCYLNGLQWHTKGEGGLILESGLEDKCSLSLSL